MLGRGIVCVWLASICLALFSPGSSAQPRVAACQPSIVVEPMSAGIAHLSVSAPCLPRRRVHFRYDALDLVRSLDEHGRLDFNFACFLGGNVALMADFQEGPLLPIQLRTLDLDRITMVAVLWKGGVNVDLHAFEYAAKLSDENHVWAGAPASRWLAEERKMRDGRGHGFISFASNGRSEGGQAEVYTFVHEPHQKSGAVTLALDFESRSTRPGDHDTCGTGFYADLEYMAFVRHPDGKISRTRGAFAPSKCNQPVGEIARYNSKALPQLFFMR
jgi:hypothetical protein